MRKDDFEIWDQVYSKYFGYGNVEGFIKCDNFDDYVLVLFDDDTIPVPVDRNDIIHASDRFEGILPTMAYALGAFILGILIGGATYV